MPYDITVFQGNATRQVKKIFPHDLSVSGASSEEQQSIGSTITARGAPVLSPESSSNPKALIILDAAGNPDGLKASKASQLTGLSRSATLALLEKIRSRNELFRKEIPHPNKGMPPTYVYCRNPELLDLEIKSAQEVIASQPPLHTELQAMSVAESPSPTGLVIDLQLASIKAPNRVDYAQVVLLVARQGEVSINQLSEAGLSASKQTNHTRLEKLRELGWLQRKKKRTESNTEQYFYFLSPAISQLNVEQLARSLGLFAPQLISESNKESFSQMQEVLPPFSSKPSSTNTLEDKSSRWAERILETLPPFDPTWSKETQERWFLLADRATKKLEKTDF